MRRIAACGLFFLSFPGLCLPARAQTPDALRAEILFHLAVLYDAYYADKQAALEQYERFLAAVEQGQLPQMEGYGQRRLQEIREKKFFEQAPPPTRRDTLVIQPADSSGGRQQ